MVVYTNINKAKVTGVQRKQDTWSEKYELNK